MVQVDEGEAVKNATEQSKDELQRTLLHYAGRLNSRGVTILSSRCAEEEQSDSNFIVRFSGGNSAGSTAASVAAEFNLPVALVRQVWSIKDGRLTSPWWEIVFTLDNEEI